jgi:hypothetical protein
MQAAVLTYDDAAGKSRAVYAVAAAVAVSR